MGAVGVLLQQKKEVIQKFFFCFALDSHQARSTIIAADSNSTKHNYKLNNV